MLKYIDSHLDDIILSKIPHPHPHHYTLYFFIKGLGEWASIQFTTTFP